MEEEEDKQGDGAMTDDNIGKSVGDEIIETEDVDDVTVTSEEVDTVAENEKETEKDKRNGEKGEKQTTTRAERQDTVVNEGPAPFVHESRMPIVYVDELDPDALYSGLYNTGIKPFEIEPLLQVRADVNISKESDLSRERNKHVFKFGIQEPKLDKKRFPPKVLKPVEAKKRGSDESIVYVHELEDKELLFSGQYNTEIKPFEIHPFTQWKHHADVSLVDGNEWLDDLGSDFDYYADDQAEEVSLDEQDLLSSDDDEFDTDKKSKYMGPSKPDTDPTLHYKAADVNGV